MMEDKLVDFPHDNLIPRVPPKTYKWEDIRRQKLEGSYPWTHVNKPPFDPEVWEKEKSLEYEPVGPMETRAVKITTAIIPPMVKITDVDTFDRERSTPLSGPTTATTANVIAVSSSPEKGYLQIPINDELDENEEGVMRIEVDKKIDAFDERDEKSSDVEQSDADDEDDDDEEEELSPHDFQFRVEERFFSSDLPPSTSAAVEIVETVPSVPPKSTERLPSTSREKTRSQISRIKEKFEQFREQRAKREESLSLSSFKNNNDSSKKSKFKIKKPKISLRPNISFPNLHFSLSRSNSVKSVDRISSQSQPKRKFDFGGTYPRIFRKKKKVIEPTDDYYEQVGPAVATIAKSAPGTPSSSNRKSTILTDAGSIFGRKFFGKFKDVKHGDRNNDESDSDVIRSSIVISMKEPSSNKDNLHKRRNEEEEEDEKPTKPIIDNKNFFFISLHEDRTDLKPPPWNFCNYDDDQQSSFENRNDNATTSATLITEKKPLSKLTKQSLWNFALKNKEHLKEANILETPETIPAVVDESNRPRNIDDETTIVIEEEDDDIIVDEENAEGIYYERQPTVILVQSTIEEVLPSSSSSSTMNWEIHRRRPDIKPRTKKRKNDDDIVSKKIIDNGIDGGSVEFHSVEDVSNYRVIDDEDELGRFEEYESALEKSKLSSDYYSAVDIDAARKDNITDNALVGLDYRPRSPVPPIRTRSLYRNKQQTKRPKRLGKKSSSTDHQSTDAAIVENRSSSEQPNNDDNNEIGDHRYRCGIYNTFPLKMSITPERPRRRYKSRRKYDNDNNSPSCYRENGRNPNRNIANSKQMSVSYLPLTCDIPADISNDISNYDLRETSSMIQLNISEPPTFSNRDFLPIPPKRRKSVSSKKREIDRVSTGSSSNITGSITPNMLMTGNDAGSELEYADDSNKTPDSSIPPARPIRRKSASTLNLAVKKIAISVIDPTTTVDDDKSSFRNDNIEDVDFRRSNNHGYAVIGKPSSKQPLDDVRNNPRNSVDEQHEVTLSSLKRRIRRISDFFTLPRVRRAGNYVFDNVDDDSIASTLPLRPPRRCNNKSYKEHLYVEDNLSEDETTTRSSKYESSKSKRAESLPCGIDDENRYLQSGVILEKMKGRPLPAPPRPSRRNKDDDNNNDDKNHRENDNSTATLDVAYSRCNKKNRLNDILTNNMNDYKEKSIERKIINTRFETFSATTTIDDINHTEQQHDDSNVGVQTEKKNSDDEDIDNNNNRNNNNRNNNNNNINNGLFGNVVRVSELNVGKLNVDQIESSKLITSNIESITLQVSSECKSEDDFNDDTSLRSKKSVGSSTIIASNEEDDNDNDSIAGRSRISSMVPEVGSDVEEDDSGRRRVFIVPPTRKKNTLNRTKTDKSPSVNINVIDEEGTIGGGIGSDSSNSHKKDTSTSKSPVEGSSNQPTLSDLTRQILEICQSSVGEAIHSMVEQFAPDNREKRNELQTAIWIITIIVAGCLVLGLGGSEKQIHHHHWDFHFPPPR